MYFYDKIHPMEIVAIDGFTLNPGDLTWQNIAQFGNLTVYERTPEGLLAERCAHANIVLTNKVAFDDNTLRQLPRLQLIAVTATGYNIVDTTAAANRGIVVCNVPAYGTASVAQHTFALILELTNAVGIHTQSVHEGDWEKNPDFSYTKTPLIELAGKTLGIVGLGNIGRQVAHIAAAFGMHVVYHNPSRKETTHSRYATLEEVFAQSDIVSLHCPLNDINHQFVNRELLNLMKPTACLINTARGQLINEQHLSEALQAGTIAGAALDVLTLEPPQPHHPLLKVKNCIITPHIAWTTKEARARIMDITAKNIEAFLQGKPLNKVN